MNTHRNVLAALILTSAAVCCLGTGACGKKSVSPPLVEGFRLDDPEKVALPVLTIGDVSYTNGDFARFVHLTVGEPEVALTAEAAGRLFDDFIDRKLIVRRAASQGIGLSEEEKSESLAAFRLNRGSGHAPAVKADPGDFLESVLVEKYLTLQVRGIVVAADEITAYYEAHKNEFLQPERLQVSQILFSAEGQASEAMEKLRSAGAEEFRKVARAESEGPEAESGGLMGVFSLGQLPLELEKVIFALEEGRISRVVQSPYGYHIFRLDRKFESRLIPPDEAVPLIEKKLIEIENQTAIDAHIVSLKETMTWNTLAENLPFVYSRNR